MPRLPSHGRQDHVLTFVRRGGLSDAGGVHGAGRRLRTDVVPVGRRARPRAWDLTRAGLELHLRLRREVGRLVPHVWKGRCPVRSGVVRPRGLHADGAAVIVGIVLGFATGGLIELIRQRIVRPRKYKPAELNRYGDGYRQMPHYIAAQDIDHPHLILRIQVILSIDLFDQSKHVPDIFFRHDPGNKRYSDIGLSADYFLS